MTAFLVDEMFPTAAAVLLRDSYGHDAVHVAEVGLRAADDAQVAATARAEGRALVTENVVDFSAEREIVLVFVLKKNLPAGGGQAARAIPRPPLATNGLSSDDRDFVPDAAYRSRIPRAWQLYECVW